MPLLNKYNALVEIAKQHGVAVNAEYGVLKVLGEVANEEIKNKIWEVYNQLHPTFKSGEVVLNVKVKSREGDKVKVVTQSGNLNIRKTPTIHHEIVGKAAHGETLTLLNKVNEHWWYIRTHEGVEGYCYSQYLEAI